MAAAIQAGLTQLFAAVSPYMMNASPTFGRALKTPLISPFLAVANAAENAKFIYHHGLCNSNLLMESVNKRWVQQLPVDMQQLLCIYEYTAQN